MTRILNLTYRYSRTSIIMLHVQVIIQILTLTEEDVYGSYSRLLLKYFSAEAAMTGHSLLLTSADQDPQQIIKVVYLNIYMKLFLKITAFVPCLRTCFYFFYISSYHRYLKCGFYIDRSSLDQY